MNINPNANEELDADTHDTADDYCPHDEKIGECVICEPPLVCEWCEEATTRLTPVEDRDRSVGYSDILRICDPCIEKIERRRR